VKNEGISKEEALENAIKISTVPHNFSLQFQIPSETLAVALPYANQIIHYVRVSEPYLDSIKVHEQTHILNLSNCDRLLIDLFFTDFVKLCTGQEPRKEIKIDIGVPFIIRPKELHLQNFYNLLEASALYSQMLYSKVQTLSPLKEFGNLVIQEYRDKRREVYECFRILSMMTNKIMEENLVKNSAKNKYVEITKREIKDSLIFALCLVETMKALPKPSEVLKNWRNLVEESNLRSALGIGEKQFSPLELGILLSLSALDDPPQSLLKRVGMKIGIYDPYSKVFRRVTYEQETYPYFLFVFACLKTGVYEHVLREQIFGISQIVMKEVFFKKILGQGANEYMSVSLPLVFYYQNDNKKEIIDCITPRIEKSIRVPKARKFKIRVGSENALVISNTHCPPFIVKKIVSPIIRGTCNLVDSCSHLECRGEPECPLKEEFYSNFKDELNVISAEKITKKLATKLYRVQDKIKTYEIQK
jgi:hypothetical protein